MFHSFYVLQTVVEPEPPFSRWSHQGATAEPPPEPRKSKKESSMVYKSLNVSVFLGYTHTSSCLALPASERETFENLLLIHPPPAHLRPPSGAQGALASKKKPKKRIFKCFRSVRPGGTLTRMKGDTGAFIKGKTVKYQGPTWAENFRPHQSIY